MGQLNLEATFFSLADAYKKILLKKIFSFSSQ